MPHTVVTNKDLPTKGVSNSLLVVPSPMEFLTSSVLVFISDRQGSLTTAVHLRIILSSPHVPCESRSSPKIVGGRPMY